jgi:hypothetical protein
MAVSPLPMLTDPNVRCASVLETTIFACALTVFQTGSERVRSHDAGQKRARCLNACEIVWIWPQLYPKQLKTVHVQLSEANWSI